MAKYVPPGFNQAQILDGLHKALGFGLPTRTEDRATFFFRTASTPTGPQDRDGVPFDPTTQETNTASPSSATVDCAVEYYDSAGQAITSGSVRPSKVKVTLLDAEYQAVKHVHYLVAGGDKYVKPHTEPPVALGTIDVWTLWLSAENES